MSITISEIIKKLEEFKLELDDVEIFEALPEYGSREFTILNLEKFIRIETITHPRDNRKEEYKLVMGTH